MLEGLVLVVGAVLGFAGSRMLRRPSHTATAASVARNVGGALGRRRGLALPDLQRAAFSEMMRHVRVGRGGQAVVPSQYVVHLHPTDMAAVEEAPRFFTDGLAEGLRAVATEHAWVINGPISIDLEADGSRHPGAPTVFALVPDGPVSDVPTPPPDALATVPASRAPMSPAAQPLSRPRSMMLERLDNEECISLTGEVTIGRAGNRTIVVDDNRVSRHHALVRPHGSGWVILDEGSSNGTRLNGNALVATNPATLRAGDIIEIGPVRFRFDVDRQPPSADATEATAVVDPDRPTITLDDATRRRMSADYLRPPAGRR